MKSAIFCKTFREDFGVLVNLMKSAEEFVDDSIFIVLSMPSADTSLAKEILPLTPRYSIVEDESYTDDKSRTIGGWLQQQVCKLSIFKLFTDTLFLMVDSDTYFISNIDQSYFFSSDQKPKFVASTISTVYSKFNEPLELFIKDIHLRSFEDFSSSKLGYDLNIQDLIARSQSGASIDSSARAAWIYEYFGIDPTISFMPSPFISTNVLKQMHDDLCLKNNLCLSDLICLAPWEYIWYGCWLISRGQHEYALSVSPTLHFPTAASFDEAKQIGLREADLAKRFAAIAMAARHHGKLKF